MLFWIGGFGTLTSILASLILNITVNDPNMWVILTLYTMGSISLGITSYIAKDSWMVLLMTWYTFINTVGMYQLAFAG
jgi:hypothetical protein